MILDMFRARIVVLMMLDGYCRTLGTVTVMHLGMHRCSFHLHLVRNL